MTVHVRQIGNKVCWCVLVAGSCSTWPCCSTPHQTVGQWNGARCRLCFLLALELVCSGFLKLGCELCQVLIKVLIGQRHTNIHKENQGEKLALAVLQSGHKNREQRHPQPVSESNFGECEKLVKTCLSLRYGFIWHMEAISTRTNRINRWRGTQVQ